MVLAEETHGLQKRLREPGRLIYHEMQRQGSSGEGAGYAGSGPVSTMGTMAELSPW